MALVAAAAAYVAPTKDTFYISADAADVAWERLDHLFDLRGPMRQLARRRQEIPGLDVSGKRENPDSSFVMLGIASTLRGGLEASKTFSYDLWTEKTRSLALAVREKAAALMDEQSQTGVQQPDRFLTYIIKVIDWALNNKAYLGMLQGWMLITGIDHTSIASSTGSRVVQIAVPRGKALNADMNSCMQTFLHNTATALKQHGYEACGKQTQEATSSALTRLTLRWI